MGLQATAIDNTLYDAFGQREVSVIYNPLNQYHVVMEVAPQFWQSPETLKNIYVSTAGGAVSGTQSSGPVAGTVAVGGVSQSATSVANDAARNASSNAIAVAGKGSASTGSAISTAPEAMIPLAAFSRYEAGTTPLSVNHQGHFAASTLSFNLPVGKSLSDAQDAIDHAAASIQMPVTVHGSFQGTAQGLPTVACK